VEAGPAHGREEEDFDFEVAASLVTRSMSPMRTRAQALAVGRLIRSGRFTGTVRQRACLEKSCRPQPLVDAHGGHNVFSSIFLYEGVCKSGKKFMSIRRLI